MRKTVKNALLVFAALFQFPIAASAHPGTGLASGFEHGLLHPLIGMDHLVVMVAVGLLAVQVGGKAVWALPGAFVAFMVIGGCLAITGVVIPNVESGILASLLVLGVLLATALRLSVGGSVFIVGLCAIFHGYAHGLEMPLSAGAITYSMGFALITTLLHVVGVTTAMLLKKVEMQKLTRWIGGAMTLGGIYMAVV